MLLRVDPFREFDRLSSRLLEGQMPSSWMTLDAVRKGDVFNLYVDLPGVDPASINLVVERNVLKIEAERSFPDAEGTPLIRERSHGRFTRQLFLSDTLDTEHMTADYTNGVLVVRIPVHASAKPRRVEIQATDTAPNSQPAIEVTAS